MIRGHRSGLITRSRNDHFDVKLVQHAPHGVRFPRDDKLESWLQWTYIDGGAIVHSTRMLCTVVWMSSNGTDSRLNGCQSTAGDNRLNGPQQPCDRLPWHDLALDLICEQDGVDHSACDGSARQVHGMSSDAGDLDAMDPLPPGACPQALGT